MKMKNKKILLSPLFIFLFLITCIFIVILHFEILNFYSKMQFSITNENASILRNNIDKYLYHEIFSPLKRDLDNLLEKKELSKQNLQFLEQKTDGLNSLLVVNHFFEENKNSIYDDLAFYSLKNIHIKERDRNKILLIKKNSYELMFVYSIFNYKNERWVTFLCSFSLKNIKEKIQNFMDYFTLKGVFLNSYNKVIYSELKQKLTFKEKLAFFTDSANFDLRFQNKDLYHIYKKNSSYFDLRYFFFQEKKHLDVFLLFSKDLFLVFIFIFLCFVNYKFTLRYLSEGEWINEKIDSLYKFKDFKSQSLFFSDLFQNLFTLKKEMKDFKVMVNGGFYFTKELKRESSFLISVKSLNNKIKKLILLQEDKLFINNIQNMFKDNLTTLNQLNYKIEQSYLSIKKDCLEVSTFTPIKMLFLMKNMNSFHQKFYLKFKQNLDSIFMQKKSMDDFLLSIQKLKNLLAYFNQLLTNLSIEENLEDKGAFLKIHQFIQEQNNNFYNIESMLKEEKERILRIYTDYKQLDKLLNEITIFLNELDETFEKLDIEKFYQNSYTNFNNLLDLVKDLEEVYNNSYSFKKVDPKSVFLMLKCIKAKHLD